MKRGFTLIELLVVISIIALLASVVLASLNAAREKGRIGAAKYFATQVDHTAGDSAIGLWDFDECSGTVVKDRSGYGNTGTMFNMGTSSWSSNTPSGTGCALSFDGATQYIDLGNDQDFSFDINSPFTFAAWVYPTAYGGQVFNKDTQSTSRYNFGLDGAGRNQCNVSGTTGGGYLTGATVLPLNKWSYIVCVYNGSANLNGLQVYTNGVLDGTGSNSALTGTMQNGTKAQIGARTNGLAPFWPGMIDSVHVFAKNLTAEEVKALYASGRQQRAVAAAP